jgi:hypothetical protein
MTLAVLLTIAIFPLSLFLLAKNPFNGASIVAALSWIFGVFPAIYFVETAQIPSYSWRNMTYAGGPLYNQYLVEPGLLSLVLMVSMFTLGCLFSEVTVKIRRNAPASESFRSNRIVDAILIGLWGLSGLYLLSVVGWRLDLFILPVKVDVKTSGYLETLFLYLPLVLFAKSYWEARRFSSLAAFWLFMAVFAAFSGPQRRDLVTVAMFVIAFVPLMRLHFDEQVGQDIKLFSRELSGRVIASLSLIGAMALVPLLWYSRNYFTAAERGAVVNVTSTRSFSDLVLGSPATGYPTYLLVQQHVANSGPDPFYTLSFLASLPVPRLLWPGKPSDIDNFFEKKYSLIENPSIFWFGELFFGFGVFAIPLAILMGFGLYTLVRWLANSGSLIQKTFAAIIFMHSLTLFKNGISHFTLNAAIVALLFAVIWMTRDRPRGFAAPSW